MQDEKITVDANSKIEVNKEGLVVKKADNVNTENSKKIEVYPSNEETVWEKDFYDLIWSTNLSERLLLLLQVLSRNPQSGQLQSFGYVVHEMINQEGKLNFGTFNLPLLVPPISLRNLDENPSARS